MVYGQNGWSFTIDTPLAEPLICMASMALTHTTHTPPSKELLSLARSCMVLRFLGVFGVFFGALECEVFGPTGYSASYIYIIIERSLDPQELGYIIVKIIVRIMQGHFQIIS